MKERVELQSVTIDNVAKQAQNAKELYEDLKKKGRQLETSLKILAYIQQDRQVPRDRRGRIIERLAEKKGETVSINSTFGDQEADFFAWDLIRVFKEAGWNVDGNKDIYGGGPGPRNVVLTVNKEENKSLAIFVGSILDFVLVDPTIRVQTNQKESLGIKIGKKTFPPFKIVPD